MELDEALRLVAARGRLMQGLPPGSMLSVRLSLEKLAGRLPQGADLAAVNGPQLCVVAGPTDTLQRLSDDLAADGTMCRMLHTSHAFHSSMMDPVVEPFLRSVESARLSSPRIPFVSTVTGDWINLPRSPTLPTGQVICAHRCSSRRLCRCCCKTASRSWWSVVRVARASRSRTSTARPTRAA